ncbi:hypothetical protein RHAB21_02273 [Pseudorhizobium halotolerans]|uniref:Uncharacterized protein n=1 Tax=Pseudorhizobium halotolerans TaxID=1233081 RepID=A0ABM8PK84_9HYPH|nr:hypothetical protein RHAB21_02273 [Pseudorhizobium halotolerans]
MLLRFVSIALALAILSGGPLRAEDPVVDAQEVVSRQIIAFSRVTRRELLRRPVRTCATAYRTRAVSLP